MAHYRQPIAANPRAFAVTLIVALAGAAGLFVYFGLASLPVGGPPSRRPATSAFA